MGDIKTNVLYEICNSLFSNNASLYQYGSHFTKLVACYMKGKLYGPRETLCIEGDFVDDIIFVGCGKMELIFNIRKISENSRRKLAKNKKPSQTLAVLMKAQTKFTKNPIKLI